MQAPNMPKLNKENNAVYIHAESTISGAEQASLAHTVGFIRQILMHDLFLSHTAPPLSSNTSVVYTHTRQLTQTSKDRANEEEEVKKRKTSALQNSLIHF